MKSLIGISGWPIHRALHQFRGIAEALETAGHARSVGRDGLHYLDGAEIDPVTLGLHEAGIEQEAEWALAVLASVVPGLSVPQIARMTRELDDCSKKKEL